MGFFIYSTRAVTLEPFKLVNSFKNLLALRGNSVKHSTGNTYFLYPVVHMDKMTTKIYYDQDFSHRNTNSTSDLNKLTSFCRIWRHNSVTESGVWSSETSKTCRISAPNTRLGDPCFRLLWFNENMTFFVFSLKLSNRVHDLSFRKYLSAALALQSWLGPHYFWRL